MDSQERLSEREPGERAFRSGRGEVHHDMCIRPRQHLPWKRLRMTCWGKFHWYLLDYFYVKTFQSGYSSGVIGQEADSF
jgi:hypothetical protein